MRKHNPIEPKNTTALSSVGKAAKYILIGFLLIIISMSAFSRNAIDLKLTIDATLSTNTFESAANIHMDRLIFEINPESINNQDKIARFKNDTPICVSTSTPIASTSYTNNPTSEYIEFLSFTGSTSDYKDHCFKFTNNKSVTVQIPYSIEIPK